MRFGYAKIFLLISTCLTALLFTCVPAVCGSASYNVVDKDAFIDDYEDSAPSYVTEVTAEGEAPANIPGAKDKAKGDALRNAVMAAIGAYIGSTTVGSNYTTIKEDIVLKADGYATVKEVIRTWEERGIVHVLVRAEVSNRPLAEKLKKLGVLKDWKFGVVISETGGKGGRYAESALIDRLIKSGWTVITRSERGELADDTLVGLASAGDKDALEKIGTRYKVDILVTGNAYADYVDSDKQGGVMFYRSRSMLVARAFFTGTGKLLCTIDRTGNAVDQTMALAANKALKNSGQRAGLAFSDAALIIPASVESHMMVSISNFGKISQAADFEKKMKDMPGVLDVKRQHYANGTLDLDVYINSEYRDLLPTHMETSDAGKKLGLKVSAWSKSFVRAEVGKG